jgi:hypothetical protein
MCAGLTGPVRAAYEAGPTGYGLARELARRGVGCVVAAPSKIPRASGERVKTDRRDAEHLVGLLLAGGLHPVRVPGAEEEALRDLVRAREAARVDLMRCRHWLSKLLLRHGIRFEDGHAWSERHRRWLATVTLEWPAAQLTLLDAIGAVDAVEHRRCQLEREIVALLAVGAAGRAAAMLRGVDTLNAARSAPRCASGRPVSRPRRSRSPGQHNDGCTASGRGSRPAPSAAQSSPSPPPASSPDPAGRSAKPNDLTRPQPSTRRLGRWRPGTARGTRDDALSNQPPGWPRSLIRQRHPTTNHGPAATRIRAYQPDPRRAQHAGTRPTQPTTHPRTQPANTGNSPSPP